MRAAELFGEHRRMILGVCRMLLRNSHDAEDAAQQTFLSAYRSMLAGAAPRRPAAWLAAIARNECLARIRSRMREPLHEVRDGASELPDPLTTAVRNADLEALWLAIGELPHQQRDALLLREFSGLSYEELATALAVSGPAVESLLFRARRELRRRLRGLEPASLAPAAAARAVFDWIAALSVPAKVVAGAAAVSVAVGGAALTVDPHMVGSAAPSRLPSPAGIGLGSGSPESDAGRASAIVFVAREDGFRSASERSHASVSTRSEHEALPAQPTGSASSSALTTRGRSEPAEVSSGAGDDGPSSGAGSGGTPSGGDDPGGTGADDPPVGGTAPGDDGTGPSGGGSSNPSGDNDPPAAAPEPGDDGGPESESGSDGPSDPSGTGDDAPEPDANESHDSDPPDAEPPVSDTVAGS